MLGLGAETFIDWEMEGRFGEYGILSEPDHFLLSSLSLTDV